MSNNEKITEQKQEKVMTKYDLKMQKRKEQKEKEKREQRRSTIISVAVVVALVCLVASFPIRNYLAINEKYITVGGEKVTRVEFDYNYNLVKNSYIAQYGSILSYLGLDTGSDLSAQMYSETLTWKDYFEKMAVDNIVQNKALLKQAETEGFTYDYAEEYEFFKKSVKDAAEQQGVSAKNYLKQLYGPYATMNRISEFVQEEMILNAYYDKVAEEKAPSDEEIQAYYNENSAEYDSVDYRVTMVAAQLPTEPTELADPVEETEDTAATTEQAYQPSEAEITKAMEDAKVLAEAAEAKVKTEGELRENFTKANTSLVIADWLFDDARKAGDTTIIEDAAGAQYYVLAFEKRYLNEVPTRDVRILLTEGDGQAILDEWKAGATVTEESFGELCKEQSVDTSSVNGGLFEGVTRNSLPAEMGDWIYDAARVSGDTIAAASADGVYTYVAYYVGENGPEWQLNIKNTLLSQTMSAYVEELKVAVDVEDPKGKLNYLKVEEQEATAESDTAEATESADTTATEAQ